MPGERIRVAIGQEPRAPDGGDGVDGIGAADGRVPRAMEHHERLGDELDVDEAPAAELDVQAPGGLLAELALHAVAQRAHLLQVRRGRVGTIEQVADHAPHRPAHARIAADEPRARQRLALPGIRPLPVVAADGVEARGKTAPLRAGTQPQVDGKDHAGGRDVAEDRAERLDGAIVEDVGLDRLAPVRPPGVIM